MMTSELMVIIPTRGRAGKQTTFAGLPAEWRRRVLFVCPKREVAQHRGNHPQAHGVIEQPDPDMTIARKRRWIMKWAEEQKFERIAMLDDDLRYAVRRRDDPKKFTAATPGEVAKYFGELERQLSELTPHAGFAARGGSISPRAQEGGWQEAKRMMYVLGLHVPTVNANCDPFRIETREDMDTCLQLLEKGLPNVVCYSFVVDQLFNAPGGASLERSFERSNSDAELLARLHPGLVKVVSKDYAASVPRLEVVVQWEKALRQGRERGKAGAPRTKDRSRRARAG